MDKVYMLIIFYYVVIKGMVLNYGSHLDHLFQKSLRYHHHKENCKISLQEGIIPTGLKLKKEPGFVPVMGQFNKKWSSILFDAERSLVELLLSELDNVIKKIKTEFDQELRKQYPDCTDVKKMEIMQKHQGYKKKIAMRRKSKWVKLME